MPILTLWLKAFGGGRGNVHSFDVRVFNPFAPGYDNTPLAQCYRRNKQKKRRAYDLTTGVDNIWRYGYQGLVVYKRLASLIAEKHDTSYHKRLHWLRCMLNFSLLRSAIVCLRGSCSTVNHPARPFITGDNIELTCSEGQVPE